MEWLAEVEVERELRKPPPTLMPNIDGPPHDLGHLIGVLDRHGVEYLMVGGVAAIGYGAERSTEDADCVVRRERSNLDRLAVALRELNARLHVGGCRTFTRTVL